MDVSVLIVVLVLTALTACAPRAPERATERALRGDSQEGQDEALEFEVHTVASKEIARDIEGLGNLVVFDKATVVSRIDGIVEKVDVKKGDRVPIGGRILEVSNYQLELEKLKTEKEVLAAQEELETAKMQYAEEEKNLYKKFLLLEKIDLQSTAYEQEIAFLADKCTRKRLLFEKGGLPEEELRTLEFSLDSKKREAAILRKEHELESHGFRDRDLVEEGYEVPKDMEEKRKRLIFINTKLLRKRIEFAELKVKKVDIELERIDWLLEKRVVRAPVAGVVTDVLKFVGEKVSADEAVTTILNQSSLVARAAFPEADLPRFKTGDEVAIFIDSIGISAKGTVHSVDPFVEVNTRSFSVDCLLKNSMGLVPGMFVRVKVPVKKVERLLLIPKKALIEEKENRGYVYIVSNTDRIFKREVSWEEYDDQSAIVTDGMREGDIIVQNPLMSLMDGMRISHKKE